MTFDPESESFQQVIKRTTWEDGPKRCGGLLARASGEISDATPQPLLYGHIYDDPPTHKWTP